MPSSCTWQSPVKYKRHCLLLPLQHCIPHRIKVLSALHILCSSLRFPRQMPVTVRPIRQTSTELSAPPVWQACFLILSALKCGLHPYSTGIWSWHRLFPFPRGYSGSCVFSVLHHLKPHVHSHQSWFPSHSLLLFPWFQDDWLLHYPRYQRISYRPDSSYPCQPSALSPDNTSSGLLRSKMAVLPYKIRFHITHASRVHLPYAHHSCSYS